MFTAAPTGRITHRTLLRNVQTVEPPIGGVEGRSPPKDIRTRDGGRRFLKAGALRAGAGVIVREKAA